MASFLFVSSSSATSTKSHSTQAQRQRRNTIVHDGLCAPELVVSLPVFVLLAAGRVLLGKAHCRHELLDDFYAITLAVGCTTVDTDVLRVLLASHNVQERLGLLGRNEALLGLVVLVRVGSDLAVRKEERKHTGFFFRTAAAAAVAASPTMLLSPPLTSSSTGSLISLSSG